MRRNRATAAWCGVVALLLLLASSVRAQDWPTRPIKIVTPLAAGGAADVIGHAVGDAFTAATKLPVIIDNRPGGGGTLAAVTVARAEPDGTRCCSARRRPSTSRPCWRRISRPISSAA